MAHKKEYMQLSELSTLCQSLGILTRQQYSDWWRSTKPTMVPGSPAHVYDEWKGWPDLLGTTNTKREYRSPDGLRVLDALRLAQKAGEKTFFIDIPCKKGHISERRTDSGSCGECQREYSRKYNNANKPRVRRNVARWQAMNADRVRAHWQKRYAEVKADPVKYKAYLDKKREYYLRNKKNVQLELLTQDD